MCERYYGDKKEVTMRDRKELKTTPRFSVSLTRKPNVLPLPRLEIHGRCRVASRMTDRWVGRDREKIIQLWHVKFEMLEGVLIEMSSTCFQF